MYAGSIPLLLGFPLLLGSDAVIVLVVPLLAAIVFRIVFEERFLSRDTMPAHGAFATA